METGHRRDSAARTKATDDAGLWRFKDGAAVYTEALRTYTTTNLNADEIHAIGLREVARLEREIDGLFRKLGRTGGSIEERFEEVRNDLAYLLDGRIPPEIAVN